MSFKRSQNISTDPVRDKTPLKAASADALKAHRTSNGTDNTLVAQIILVVVIAGAILLFERFFGKEPPVVRDGSEKEAALLIDFDDMKRMFEGEVVEGMTVLDALNASVAAGQIKLTYHVDGDNNTRVTEINDHTIAEDIQFTFYVNSRKLDPSELNKTPVRPGDTITITLE